MPFLKELCDKYNLTIDYGNKAYIILHDKRRKNKSTIEKDYSKFEKQLEEKLKEDFLDFMREFEDCLDAKEVEKAFEYSNLSLQKRENFEYLKNKLICEYTERLIEFENKKHIN
ncbi:hypothetical protein D3C87_78370 [compost metagenome]